MRFAPAALFAALAFAPTAATAQMVIAEPPMYEDAPIIEEAPMAGPLTTDGAVAIAMMNGVAVVEDVDQRFWDGNYEVEGTDDYGEDIEVTIDHVTGAVIDIDD